MKWKQLLLIVVISAGSALGGAWMYNSFFVKDNNYVGSAEKGIPVNYAGFFDSNRSNSAEAVDLTKAANATVPAVVHIKTKVAAKKRTNDLPSRQRSPFDDFFNDVFPDYYGPNMMPEQRASGSGVIISEDGYIVTNNHVISNGSGGVADEINVTLSTRKSYKARVIGRDPASDIAVLKIDGSKFPFLVYGNSNNVQLGQWVLAVGYPLSLEATVTAGIISATGRSININRRQIEGNVSAIESFIQTDAAVNQGNSGGALVNANGELVGINSAILAPTGTYAGYSFAIPVNIARKIVDDIIKTGEVQRGYLGISYPPTEELTQEQLKANGIPTDIEGVYVSDVSADGGAAAAGIKKGDIITKVNNVPVYTGLQMSAQIAAYRPGDQVPVSYIRNGKEFTTSITLKKKPGSFEGVALQGLNRKLGAQLSNLTAAQAKEFGVNSGVLVLEIGDEGPISRTRISEGYIITKANGQTVRNLDDLNKAVSGASGTLRVEGVYPGFEGVYPYVIRLD
jgi:serine protease Do